MWLLEIRRVNNLSSRQTPGFIFLCPSAHFACIQAVGVHMYPSLCIRNEYAFKKQAHKSSKAGSELLGGGPAARCRWRYCDGVGGVRSSDQTSPSEPLRSPAGGAGSARLLFVRGFRTALSMKFMEENARLFVMNAEQRLHAFVCNLEEKNGLKAETSVSI